MTQDRHAIYSMRPITLSRVIDLCLLAKTTERITLREIAQNLETSQQRAKEMVSELKNMYLLQESNDGLSATQNTLVLLNAFELEDWKQFSNYFYHHHIPYRTFVDFMTKFITSEAGLTVDEIIEIAKKRYHLNFNRTSIEVLTNWSERIGQTQRNAFSGRFYIIRKKAPSLGVFRVRLKGCYDMLNSRQGLGLRQVYVEIPRLRECVCETLHLSREIFDQMILQIHARNISNIELAGAPTTTATKKSRYSIRKMLPLTNRKDEILSPKIDLERMRKGIEIHGKMYFYLALHSRTLA